VCNESHESSGLISRELERTMRSRGDGLPSWPIRRFSDLAFWIRDRAVFSVAIPCGERELVFRCRSRRALRRATTLFVKEQGTIEWLRDNVRRGDVVLDIGANVGIYTLLAAERVGESGQVFAVEPHMFNATTLLENVAANRFSDRVSVLTLALGERVGFDSFNYRDWEIGSAFSQLGSVSGEGGQIFEPVAREWKTVATVDFLVEQGAIAPPTLVKLDVDGREAKVLAGMRNLLAGDRRPRSVQVEISKANRHEVESLMRDCGFHLQARHHTKAGRKRIARGAHELEQDHNAIFAPAEPPSPAAAASPPQARFGANLTEADLRPSERLRT
jgi:FkbM family methyltransferase